MRILSAIFRHSKIDKFLPIVSFAYLGNLLYLGRPIEKAGKANAEDVREKNFT